jgi:phosphatidylglycerol lysyltransferase
MIHSPMTAIPTEIAISAWRPMAETAPRRLLRVAAGDVAPAEHHAYRFGRSYDSYLVTEPGWEHFWSSGRHGMIAVARRGRHLFCGGGLLAPAEHQAELLRQFVAGAAGSGRTVTFLNVCEEQLPLFRDLGFQATKWGEEAIVDLPPCEWAGKSYEWVRRQTNFCRRHGLEFFECRREEHTPDRWTCLLDELSQVSRLFLDGKPQSREMHFLQGGFDPWRPGRQRLFAAQRRPGGRIEGFLACNPCDGGRTWVMETCRQRPDAVRGTVPFLMHQAMHQLRSEGVLRASLCLLPGLRCREPLPGDSPMVRWGLTLGTGALNPAYATAGAYHFKSRFRPRFEGRYLCAYPRVTCGTALAFIRLVGALSFDPRRLFALAWQRWQKRAARATLIAPDGAE